MRILFVADTYYPHMNGVYYFVQRLATHLQNEGHQVAVIAPSENIHFTKKRIDNILVYGIPSLSVLFYSAIRFPIPFLLKSHIVNVLEIYNPDVIHIQNHFSLNKALIKVNKKFGFPIVATNHFMPENFTSFLSSVKWKKKIKVWMWAGFATVYNKAKIVVTPTETAADLIRSKLSVDVRVISNGIDFEKFNPKQVNDTIRNKYSIPQKPILLYVGRLDPEKHLDEILHAVASAIENTNFCFVIAGKGFERATLKRATKKLGIEEDVIFTGFVSDEDLPQLYRISHCFITASIAELQSIATMEAMASGLPVIAANAGALGELVNDKQNGYLFEPGDVKTLTHCINVLFSNSNLHKEMSEMSLKKIVKHDLNETVELYKKLYMSQIRLQKA